MNISGYHTSDYESEKEFVPVCLTCGKQHCQNHLQQDYVSSGVWFPNLLTTGMYGPYPTSTGSNKLYWDEKNQSWKDIYGNIIPDVNVINRNKHKQLISDYIRSQDITSDRINVSDVNIDYNNEFPELKLSEDPTYSYDKSYSTFSESKLNIDFYSAWEKLKEIPLNKKIRNNTIFVAILIAITLAIKALYSL